MSKLLTYSIMQQGRLYYNPGTLLDDLLVVYELDETTGTTVNDSHGNYDGTNSDAIINDTGRVSRCYLFNNSDAHIYTSLIPDPAGSPYSVGLWFYPSSSYNANSRLFSKRIKYPLRTDTSSGFEIDYNSYTGVLRGFNVGKSVVSTTVSVKINKWSHVVLVYDGTTLYLYLNGMMVKSALSGYNNNSEVCVIGNMFESDYQDLAFRGKIDQVFIYSKALSKSEILAIYRMGKGIPYTNWGI